MPDGPDDTGREELHGTHVVVLERGWETYCDAAHAAWVEGGQHDGPDRDRAQDGLGEPRY